MHRLLLRRKKSKRFWLLRLHTESQCFRQPDRCSSQPQFRANKKSGPLSLEELTSRSCASTPNASVVEYRSGYRKTRSWQERTSEATRPDQCVAVALRLGPTP